MATKTVEIPYAPRPWQVELHEARARYRFRVCVVHRQGGKSEAACLELIHQALKATGDLPRFAYVSPELRLGRKMFWPKLKQRLAPLIQAGLVEIHEGDLVVRFKSNGATIEMFGASDPETLRGHTLRGVVVDEVALMPSKLWGTILEPMLMVNKGWALFIGTPDGINLFSDLYEKAMKGEPGWWGRRWTVYETNALDPAEVERKRASTSENEFAREFLCDFSAESNQQLISVALATAASMRTFPPSDRVIAASPVIIGVDPARFGDDRSVIVRRQGLHVFAPLVFKGVDTMFLASRVAMEINQHKPSAVFVDEGGVGAGVVDRLRQLGHTVIGVQFGAKALTKGFLNRRAEMWWKMKEWLESGGAIPNDPVLVRELATPTYGFNGRGDVVLESKDDIKERLSSVETGGSPDVADALACTFAAPVATKVHMLEEDLLPRRARGDYDPFDMQRILRKR